MRNPKYNTNEYICETETDSQTQRTDSWLQRGRTEGERSTGSLGSANVNPHTQDGETRSSCREHGTIFNIL